MARTTYVAYACVVQEDQIERGDILITRSREHTPNMPIYWGLPRIQGPIGTSPEELLVNEVNRIFGTKIRPDQATLRLSRQPKSRSIRKPATNKPERMLYLVTYTADQFIMERRQGETASLQWDFASRKKLESMADFSSPQRKLIRAAKLLRVHRD